jgi:uncharacterized cupredoxin-like copper-binding protein
VRLRVAAAALLAVSLGCSSLGGAAAQQEVHVTLRFSRFVPDHFEFAAGTTVKFVVENKDPIDHEFIIGDRAVQLAHEKGTESHHAAPGELSIPAGKVATTTYTFTEPGRLLIGCHLPTHYAYGMRGDITIHD